MFLRRPYEPIRKGKCVVKINAFKKRKREESIEKVFRAWVEKLWVWRQLPISPRKTHKATMKKLVNSIFWDSLHGARRRRPRNGPLDAVLSDSSAQRDGVTCFIVCFVFFRSLSPPPRWPPWNERNNFSAAVEKHKATSRFLRAKNKRTETQEEEKFVIRTEH